MNKNILANYFGRFWSVFLNFIFIPIYIKILGIENYSIISFSIVLNGIILIMDAGLTATLAREFASNLTDNTGKFKIFKSLESCYLILSSISVIILFVSSSYIANDWLNLNKLNPHDVEIYLKIISFELGIKLLGNFYNGGLLGLEKQVRSNLYQVIYSIIRNGLVLIPIFFFPSLWLFFIWQLVISILYVGILRFDLVYIFTNSSVSFFSKLELDYNVLKNVCRFAGGMMLISIVAGLNTQLDKLVLSEMLPLEILGVYTLSFALCTGLNILSSPISTALLPRLTKLYSVGNRTEAMGIYNNGNIAISILVFSCTAVLFFYSKEIVFVWTNDMDIATVAGTYVPWIALGSAFLTMQNLPFNIAIANGFTNYNNFIGIASLIVTIPGYLLMTNLFGAVGAAITYSFVQIITCFVLLFFINKRFIGMNYISHLAKSYLIPFIVSFALLFVMHTLFTLDFNRFYLLIELACLVLITIFLNVFISIPMVTIKNLVITYFETKK